MVAPDATGIAPDQGWGSSCQGAHQQAGGPSGNGPSRRRASKAPVGEAHQRSVMGTKPAAALDLGAEPTPHQVMTKAMAIPDSRETPCRSAATASATAQARVATNATPRARTTDSTRTAARAATAAARIPPKPQPVNAAM